jgi:hypothetical protein
VAGEVERFAAAVRDPATEEVLGWVRERKAQGGEGAAGWLVTQHPKWLDRATEDAAQELQGDESQGDGDRKSVVVKEEGVDAIVKQFQEDHPDVMLSFGENEKEVDIFTVPKRFTVGMLTIPAPSSRSIQSIFPACRRA